MIMKGFTTKRVSQKRDSDFSFVNECREQTRRCSYSGAFTLIETMVAVSILMLAVAGPLFTAGRAIVAAVTARDQLTASYLAQEGIEYVRAMRDNEFLITHQAGGANVSSTAWDRFLNGSDSASITQCRTTTCTVDTYPTVLMGTGSGFSLQPSSAAPLYLVNGFYTQRTDMGGVQTPFVRTIQVVDASPGGATDVRVVSTVTWNYHDVPYMVRVYDHFTPWQ